MRDSCCTKRTGISNYFVKPSLSHYELYHRLKSSYVPDESITEIDPSLCYLINQTFESKRCTFVPHEDELAFRDPSYKALFNYYLSNNKYSNEYIFKSLTRRDQEVTENKRFRYTIFTPSPAVRAQEIIFLFHGLNEKYWTKYLPWAKALAEMTGKAVVLFPIAFHMDRAPKPWSDPRLMREVVRERSALFPDMTHASFANTAMSHRLQFAPQRFLLSGMQTYYDIIELVNQIRANRHFYIDADASIDFFAYSVGGLLAQVLLMTNPNNIFDDTRLCMLAGGAVLQMINPVSKAIMDSSAHEAVTQFYEKICYESDHSSELTFFSSNHLPGLKYFKTLLRTNFMASVRQQQFTQVGKRMLAIALAGDQVIPADGIIETGKSGDQRALWNTTVMDFPFPYSHENPFPVHKKWQKDVDVHFLKIMDLAASHFS